MGRRRNSKNGLRQKSWVQKILVSYDSVRGARGQVKRDLSQKKVNFRGQRVRRALSTS